MEGSIEDGDLRHVGEVGAGDPDALEVRRVVQGSQGDEPLDRRLHRVVDSGGLAEVGAPVDDSVPDSEELDLGEVGAVLAEGAEHELEGRAMIGQAGLLTVILAAHGMPCERGGLADPLDQPAGEGLGRADVDEVVLE